jgi:hypothetical protein
MPRIASSDADDRWTDRAKQVSDNAWQQACRRGHDHIGAEHYLIALLDIDRGAGVALLVLESLGLPVEQLRQGIDTMLGNSGSPHEHGIPTTPEVWRVLKAARTEATAMGHELLGTEHLLLGIATERNSRASQALNELGATPDRIREAIHHVLGAYTHGRPPAPDGTPYPSATLPHNIRELDNRITELRQRKNRAIDARDQQTAEAIRQEEKQALTERAAAVRAWAPHVDVARIVGEVEYLRLEVQRLRNLLLEQGVDVDEVEQGSGSATEAPE